MAIFNSYVSLPEGTISMVGDGHQSMFTRSQKRAAHGGHGISFLDVRKRLLQCFDHGTYGSPTSSQESWLIEN